MLENIEKGFTSEQLDAVLDVFTTEGWKIIQHDMELYRKQLDSLNDIKDQESLFFRRGELSTLDWFINLKQWYQAAQAYEENL